MPAGRMALNHGMKVIALRRFTITKKGPTDPIDPQKIVGSYSYSTSNGSGTVQYSYTGGPSFTYFVQFISTGSYRFCPTGGGGDLIITVAPKAGCPSS